MIELYDEAIIAAHLAMEPVRITATRLGLGHDTITRRRKFLRLIDERRGRPRAVYENLDGMDSRIPGCKVCGLRDVKLPHKPLEPHECLDRSLVAVGTRGLGGWVL